MPHQCTGCGHVFDDGSKEMLGGCPECGGNTFQFYPAGADIPADPDPDAAPPDRETNGVTERMGRATTTVRDWVDGGGRPAGRADAAGDDPDLAPWPGEREATAETGAVEAATDAERTEDDIIDADAVEPRLEADTDPEVAEPPDDAPTASDGVAAPADGSPTDRPRPPGGDADTDLQALREELNDQFESIRIVEPGEYELNLMGLYDREEYVVALRENGRYVIQMPDDWGGRAPADRD